MINIFYLLQTLFAMGNIQPTEQTKTNALILNRNNIEDVDSYGCPVLPGKFSFNTIAFHDCELSTCIKNIINMFDYEVHIQHDDNKIIDPIVIIDKPNNNTYKLSKLHYDFRNRPAEAQFSNYELKINDSHVYKFSHITNVQLYFEMRNNNFAKY